MTAVINNYNYGRFLADAIESTLAQCYARVEVVVVDDGSTDDSRDVIGRFGPRVRAVLKANGGQGSAYNAGFAASRGDIVAFLDADDVWLPGKVEAVVRAAAAAPDALLLYHRVQHVLGDGRRDGTPWPVPLLHGSVRDRSQRAGGWWPYPPSSALAFRRAFLERVLPMPEPHYRIGADAYLADLVPFLGTVHGMPEALALYRLHGANSDATIQARRLGGRAGEDERAAAWRKQAAYYERRVAGLNDALARLGRPERVRLEDHWPYQRLRHLLGDGRSTLGLTLMALRYPGDPRLVDRAKSAVKLWLAAAGMRRI